MKRDLFNPKPEVHEKQDAMARNISKLKSNDAKKAQVHVLCHSLVAMMKVRSTR
ncbi:hypothetical protein 8G_00062 [Ralstonia phage Hyacinthe]|uniref:Uncharacterized protein n=3 Tax=Rahariannevirus raharianne TaxID=2846050 RepID=A0A7G5BBA0_9CAUD|nr:hypothetical protein KMC43_gp04 [Ralstonia phage Raharianne]QMV32379.1 hypothetical protein U2_00004 [Ralstonia phage Albius]QMV33494.1 hypothetical protein 8G_00062 [Ralstonia phage Hyacinthe]QMV33573.1 hypothetical protein Y2_00004 [Ralstonia phage Raharianne]